VSATSDDGTQEELVEAAYLPALATARRLVQEARTPGGTVAYDALAGRWLVMDAQGTPSASIAVSGPCTGEHATSPSIHPSIQKNPLGKGDAAGVDGRIS